VLLALLSIGHGSAWAATAEELTARVALLNQTERYWRDRSARLTLTLFDKSGAEQKRELELYQKRYADNKQRSIVFFRAPATLKDVGILEYQQFGQVTEQWLYQPTVRRARRITSKMDESLMGTDFTTHDFDLLAGLPAQAFADNRVVLQGEARADGVEVFVLEYSMAHHASYKRASLWLGKSDLATRRLELYDHANRAVKRIVATDVRMMGRIPVAFRIEGETLGANTRTVMNLEKIEFDQGLEDDLFTEGALERGGRWK